MLLALAGVSSVAMAQQKTEVVEEFGVIQVQDKYQVITNSFWSNWFFSIGGGAEATFGDNDKAGSFGKRISPTLNFAIGKWFTPGLGVRLQYSGLQARGYTYDAGADYVKGTQMDDGYYKQRFDYMNLHGDVMFNLNALFGGYNQHRVYEIIPYVGAGFTHNYTKPHREALSVNAGIINRFRISNAIDINLEPRQLYLSFGLRRRGAEEGEEHVYRPRPPACTRPRKIGRQHRIHLPGCLLPSGTLRPLSARISESERTESSLPTWRSGRYESEEVPQRNYAGDTGAYPQPPQGV